MFFCFDRIARLKISFKDQRKHKMLTCWKSAYLHFDINKHNGNLSWNFAFKLIILTIGGVQWFLMTVMLSVTPSKKTAKAGSCICWPTASTVSKIASTCSSWDPATRPTQHLLAKSIPCVPGMKLTELEFDKDSWWYGSSLVYLKQSWNIQKPQLGPIFNPLTPPVLYILYKKKKKNQTYKIGFANLKPKVI